MRPHLLTDDPGTGLIEAGEKLDRGEIPRDDVAATLLGVLYEPKAVKRVFEERKGETRVRDALAALPGS